MRKHGWRRLLTYAGLLVGVGTAASVVDAALTGAIYTTEVDSSGECTGVDVNLYAAKEDVYLDGGPRHLGSGTQLPDGDYYVQVTDPSGATVLGSSVNNNATTQSTSQTPVHVVDGSFEDCYQLWAIVSIKCGNARKQGYKDTPNNGGVYKVWISQTSTFENSENKTDNFKVKARKETTASVTVRKFYDADLDGEWDADEPEIPGWIVYVDYPGAFDLLDGNVLTPFADDIPTPSSGSYTYVFTEVFPNDSWIATTPTTVTIQASAGGSYDVIFGNVCLDVVTPEMLTKGGWHNKVYDGTVTEDDLAGLRDLCLTDRYGDDFDPTANFFVEGSDDGSKYSSGDTNLSPWLVANNSGPYGDAQSLSQQLAAFYLNVQHALGPNGYVYAPGFGDAGPGGDYILATDLVDLANQALCDGDTDAYGALRTLLDDANNELVNFLAPSPEPCEFEY